MSTRIVGYAIGLHRGAKLQPYLEDEVYLTEGDALDDARILRERFMGSEYRVYELREVAG